jgi:hypothetical protein
MEDYPTTSDEDDDYAKYWFQDPDPPSKETEVVKPPDEQMKDNTAQVINVGVIDPTPRRTWDPTPHIGVSSSRDSGPDQRVPKLKTSEGGSAQITQGTVSTRTRKTGVSYNDNPHRVTDMNQLWRIKDTKLQHSGSVMVGQSTLGRDAGHGLFYTGKGIDNGVPTLITAYNNKFWLSEGKAREYGDDVILFVDDKGRNVYVPRNTYRYGGFINDPLDESKCNCTMLFHSNGEYKGWTMIHTIAPFTLSKGDELFMAYGANMWAYILKDHLELYHKVVEMYPDIIHEGDFQLLVRSEAFQSVYGTQPMLDVEAQIERRRVVSDVPT